MGWQDRDYAGQGGSYGGHRPIYQGPGMSAYSVVTKIIIANVVVFFLTFNTNIGFDPQTRTNLCERLFPMQANAVLHGEIWRLFTATYMHASFPHIFMNMLILYFFGPLMERRLGGKQFFYMYTLGGIAGNILLTLAGLVNFINPLTLGVGASGSVWTIMAAAAVYYPNAEVLIYFLFPVRIRTVVGVYAVWYVINVLQKGSNFGGDLCHLAGLAFGIWWAMSGGFAWAGGTPRSRAPVRTSSRPNPMSSTFHTTGTSGGLSAKDRVKQRQIDAQTVDRILAKVYDTGIHSLTPEERKALNEATARMKAEEAQAGKPN